MKRVFLYCLIALIFVAFHGPSVWLAYFLQFPREGLGGAEEVFLNGVIFILWSGIHSFVSRRFAKDFMGKLVGEDFIKPVFVIIMGITQCFMLYYWYPLQGTLWRAEDFVYWVLTILFLSCFGFVFYSSLVLDYLEVLGVRKILRRLRCEPSKPPVLVLKGPYRYCRHPVYLAVMVSLWIGPVMTYGRLEFAILGTVYILIGTWLEEITARSEIGGAYDIYRTNVPMWIPRITPWEGDN